MKIAYLCEPQLGGTYTFFKTLRPLLRERGIDFVCVSEASPDWLANSRFSRDDGVMCAAVPPTEPLPGQTRHLIRFLEEHAFQAIVVLPGCSLLTSNLPRYLPRSMKCFVRVPMMTRGAYAPTCAIQKHVNGILAISERIQSDLIRQYGVPRDLIHTIWHGVAASPESVWKPHKSSSPPFRLLYAGRLTDLDKGVFLLPDIMRHLVQNGGSSKLTILGTGEDGDKLKQKFENAGLLDCVDFGGKRSTTEMPDIYRNSDILLLPSRFEGCGFSLLEAMAEGCAPVASDIQGSVRTILDHGRAGKLARVGDARAFAQAILEWEQNPRTLANMQQAAHHRTCTEYPLEKMGDAYASVFLSATHTPDGREAQIPLEKYTLPVAMRPSWRTLVPRPIKNWARTWLERFGVST